MKKPKPILTRRQYLGRMRRRAQIRRAKRFMMAASVILLAGTVGILSTYFFFAGIAALFG